MKAWLAIFLALLWVLPSQAATSVEKKKSSQAKSAAKTKIAKLKAASKERRKVAEKSPGTNGVGGVTKRLSGIRGESELQKEVAAARATLANDPRNVEAKEILARSAVTMVDWLLSAEANGNIAKTERLWASLSRDFPDVGWRIQQFAQKKGDPKARQALGVFYGRGLILPRDSAKSCAEFKAAADQLSGAAWHYAQCIFDTSPDTAWAWMERAALGGHATAQEWIGRRCLGEFGTKGKDYSCAREWLSQSASLGRPRAQTLFAYLLSSGQGGPVDISRAIRLYRLASDQGDPDAQNNLGEIFESGRGSERNIEEALRWYEKAAQSGLAAGQFNAGRVWAAGLGEKGDPAKARAYLVQAEKNGIAEAREVLDWLDKRFPDSAGAPTPRSVSGIASKDAKGD